MQVECGKRYRVAAAARGRQARAVEPVSTVSGPRPRTARWEAFKENGRMGSSGAGEWDRSPNPEVSLGDISLRPHGPNFIKPSSSISERLSFSSKALTKPRGGGVGHGGLEHVLLAADRELLSSCLKLTDTALLEEASRYPADPKLSFLGARRSLWRGFQVERKG